MNQKRNLNTCWCGDKSDSPTHYPLIPAILSRMIGYLEGTIQHIGTHTIVINTQGVGYIVFTHKSILATFTVGQNITLWTYLAVRETSLDLFGFRNQEELSFFKLLLDVSGIGPKSALAILELAPLATLRKAIASGDTAYLSNVSGIGKKTAAKIVVELKDKLATMIGDEGLGLTEESEALEALCSLGYARKDAREALQKVSIEAINTQTKITEALKILSNHI